MRLWHGREIIGENLWGLGVHLVLLAVVLPVALSRVAWAAAPAAGPLVFGGSGGNLVATRLLAKAFASVRPQVNIEVVGGMESSGGIRAAAEGAITVGLVSRALHDSEKGLGLTVLPYARTTVVFGAHPTVTEDGITADDLVQISRGARTRWKDGNEMMLFTREQGDSTIEVLEREIPGFKEAYRASQGTNRWTVLYTPHEMARSLARTPSAFGFTSPGDIRSEPSPIKILNFNGVFPTPEAIRSGRYPLFRVLAFVFRSNTVPAEAMAFMHFARSREGKKILSDNGFLPEE